MRPAIRLASLMGQPVVYVFTHDSIGLGEDGPTHQPVEQLMSLRCIPGLTDLRPADPAETAVAWEMAMAADGPSFLALTRQKVPALDRDSLASAGGLRRGGYVLAEADGGSPEALLLASGSEVAVALDARRTLQAEGIPTRVVSLPSWHLFEMQDADYRESVLPSKVKLRVAVEAGITRGWERWTGRPGAAVGVDRFGASAPAKVLFQELGVTAEAVVGLIHELRGA
jgi:transketolase